jgi:hypothetical protein
VKYIEQKGINITISLLYLARPKLILNDQFFNRNGQDYLAFFCCLFKIVVPLSWVFAHPEVIDETVTQGEKRENIIVGRFANLK